MTGLDKPEPYGAEIQRQLEVLSSANAELLRANESLVLASERYLVLHDLAPTPLVTVDQLGVIDDVNHAAEQLFGVVRTQLLGQPFVAFVDVPTKLPVGLQLRALFVSGSMGGAEMRVLREGAPIDILVEGVVLPDRGPARAVLACVDVTARRLYEAERRLVAVRAEEAHRLESLGVLAGGIAHDFNNLMTVVLAGTEYVLGKLAVGSECAVPLAEVQQAARNAADLAHQMLAYSGHVTVPAHPISLVLLVRALEPLVHASAQSTPVIFDLAEHLPSIAGDELQLRQAVLNLVINAAESMVGRPGAITISIRAEMTGLVGDVVLEVMDVGSGMSPESRVRIFDPYYSTKFVGRGLGLAVVHGVVRGHDGSISVESKLGQGTTVSMRFPAIAEPSVSEPSSGVAAPEGGIWYGRGTVLLVDDDETVRTALGRTIKKLGLSVVVVASGGEALAALSEEPGRIDLVITDLTMPGMNGVALAEEIRERYGVLPIILITGYGTFPQDSSRLFASVLSKPFDLAELRSVLRQHLPAAAP